MLIHGNEGSIVSVFEYPRALGNECALNCEMFRIKERENSYRQAYSVS